MNNKVIIVPDIEDVIEEYDRQKATFLSMSRPTAALEQYRWLGWSGDSEDYHHHSSRGPTCARLVCGLEQENVISTPDGCIPWLRSLLVSGIFSENREQIPLEEVVTLSLMEDTEQNNEERENCINACKHALSENIMLHISLRRFHIGLIDNVDEEHRNEWRPILSNMLTSKFHSVLVSESTIDEEDQTDYNARGSCGNYAVLQLIEDHGLIILHQTEKPNLELFAQHIAGKIQEQVIEETNGSANLVGLQIAVGDARGTGIDSDYTINSDGFDDHEWVPPTPELNEKWVKSRLITISASWHSEAAEADIRKETSTAWLWYMDAILLTKQIWGRIGWKGFHRSLRMSPAIDYARGVVLGQMTEGGERAIQFSGGDEIAVVLTNIESSVLKRKIDKAMKHCGLDPHKSEAWPEILLDINEQKGYVIPNIDFGTEYVGHHSPFWWYAQEEIDLNPEQGFDESRINALLNPIKVREAKNRIRNHLINHTGSTVRIRLLED